MKSFITWVCTFIQIILIGSISYFAEQAKINMKSLNLEENYRITFTDRTQKCFCLTAEYERYLKQIRGNNWSNVIFFHIK